MPSALLFDVGDVLMESDCVVLDELERRTGRTFTGRGALDPAGDPAWQRCLTVAEGLDAARTFHKDRLGLGGSGRRNYQLHKTLRAAEGDTISVEWESSYCTDNGQLVRGRAGEFWTMRYGLLIEWHAYHTRLPDDGSTP